MPELGNLDEQLGRNSLNSGTYDDGQVGTERGVRKRIVDSTGSWEAPLAP